MSSYVNGTISMAIMLIVSQILKYLNIYDFFFPFLKYRILDSSSMSISRKCALAVQNILQGNMKKSDKYMVVCPCIYPSFSVNVSEMGSQVGSVRLALCGVLVPVRFFSPRLSSLWCGRSSSARAPRLLRYLLLVCNGRS